MKPSINFGMLQEQILRQQVLEHEQFLTSFTKLFKEQDSDLDGIINDEQFYNLIGKMKIGIEKD